MPTWDDQTLSHAAQSHFDQDKLSLAIPSGGTAIT